MHSSQKSEEIGTSIAALYAKIISYDQALGAKYDLETRLWKNAIYPAVRFLALFSRT